jgi:hypothetical protein
VAIFTVAEVRALTGYSRVIRHVLMFVGVGAVLTGCFSASFEGYLHPNVQPLDPLALTPAVESSFLRVDIVRGTHPDTTVTITNPDGSKAPPKMKDNDYSEVVVDFGNGIILDSNNNLSIDLLRLYGMENLASYHIIKRPADLFDSAITYDLRGGVFTSKVGWIGARRKAVLDGTQLRVESGLMHPKKTISIGARSVQLVTKDLLGQTTSSAASLADDGSLQMSGVSFGTYNPEHVGAQTQDNLQIEKIEDHLRISIPYGYEYRFYRIKDGVLFYPTFYDQVYYSYSRSVQITREGNRIRVTRGEQVDAEYDISVN